MNASYLYEPSRAFARPPAPPAYVPWAALRALQQEFDFMSETFAASGGMFNADVLASRKELQCANGLGKVARWIVNRNVVSVHWRGTYWVPAFQFSHPSLQLHKPLAPVLAELQPVMDDWCLAHWFASANECLDGSSPADSLGRAPSEVWDAARVQRFAIRG